MADFELNECFSSHEEFRQKLELAQQANNYQFVVAGSEKAKPEDYQRFKYRFLRLVCKQGQRRHAPVASEDSTRPNQSTYKVGCPAMLNVRLNKPGGIEEPFLKVTKLIKDHVGHSVSKEMFMLYPEQRRLCRYKQARAVCDRIASFLSGLGPSEFSEKLFELEKLISSWSSSASVDVSSVEAKDKMLEQCHEALKQERKKMPVKEMLVEDVHLFSKDKLKNTQNCVVISAKKKKGITKRLGHTLLEKSRSKVQVDAEAKTTSSDLHDLDIVLHKPSNFVPPMAEEVAAVRLLTEDIEMEGT